MNSNTLVLCTGVFLLTSVALATGSCDLLVYYKGGNFMNTARVHRGFQTNIRQVNAYVSFCGVKVYVTSSFRKSGQHIGGAIVKPARRSNHFVGHAIDMNLSAGRWCNSRCLRSYYRYPKVKCFIREIRRDRNLRWGGDFGVRDVVHIDDGINLRQPATYNTLYNQLQKNCR